MLFRCDRILSITPVVRHSLFNAGNDLDLPRAPLARLDVDVDVDVDINVSLSVVLRWLRRHSDLPSHTDALMVTDEQGVYPTPSIQQRVISCQSRGKP